MKGRKAARFGSSLSWPQNCYPGLSLWTGSFWENRVIFSFLCKSSSSERSHSVLNTTFLYKSNKLKLRKHLPSSSPTDPDTLFATYQCPYGQYWVAYDARPKFSFCDRARWRGLCVVDFGHFFESVNFFFLASSKAREKSCFLKAGKINRSYI